MEKSQILSDQSIMFLRAGVLQEGYLNESSGRIADACGSILLPEENLLVVWTSCDRLIERLVASGYRCRFWQDRADPQ